MLLYLSCSLKPGISLYRPFDFSGSHTTLRVQHFINGRLWVWKDNELWPMQRSLSNMTTLQGVKSAHIISEGRGLYIVAHDNGTSHGANFLITTCF